MHNLFSKAVVACGLMLAMASCKKDETQAVLAPDAALQLTASATTATLVKTNASAQAVTYTWQPANFGYQAAVKYTLQFAKQGTNFAGQKAEVAIPDGSAPKKSFTVEELNTIYSSLDCKIAGTTTALSVRLKATVADNVPTLYSNLGTITATPYEAQNAPADSWGVIGAATPGGWNADTPMTYDFCSRTWAVTIALVPGEFKFRSNNAWTVNLGEAATPTGNASTTGRLLAYNVAPTPNPANLSVATAGTYRIVLDLNGASGPMYTLK